MQRYVTNKVLDRILSDPSQVNIQTILSHEAREPDTFLPTLLMGWPTFLHYVGLSDLFKDFPPFNLEPPLFAAIIKALREKMDDEVLIRLYDQMFVECLTYVKAIPGLHPAPILKALRENREHLAEAKLLFSETLAYYEKRFSQDPQHTMHDLILYLGWDRMCVHSATLFEHLFAAEESAKRLLVFRDCLIESFQHITEQAKTTPGFFRLVEALYAYDMREEHLQTHTEEEWSILCKSAPGLRERECLHDLYHIDAAIFNSTKEEGREIVVFTSEKEEKRIASQMLANLFLSKLKKELALWPYKLSKTRLVDVPPLA